MNPTTLARVAARRAACGPPSSHCRWGSRQRPWNGATRLVSNYDHPARRSDDPTNDLGDIDDPPNEDDRRKGDSPSPLTTYSSSTEETTSAPSHVTLLHQDTAVSGYVPSTEWIPPRPPPSTLGPAAAPFGNSGMSSSTGPESMLHSQGHLTWVDAKDGYGRMVTPAESLEIRRRGRVSDLPIIRHTLLSRDEIGLCLRETGGQDVVVIMDDEDRPRMGGATGMILATASTLHQLRSMADELVGQLRRRKLHEVGVVGAEMGPEGSLRDDYESWFVVDCQNYVVHLMDETTRRCLRLEDLWSGRDGLHRLNVLDEDAVDAFVSDHPVPDEYGRGSLDMDETLRMLEKVRWSAVSRPGTAEAKPKARRRRGRRGYP